MRWFDLKQARWSTSAFPTDEELWESEESLPEWDRVPQTTRWERWAYYLYYNGNNGINNYSYVPNMVQYLISINGWDPTQGGPGMVKCGADTDCETRIGSVNMSVESIILLNNGVNALVQAILLTTFGTLADYGNNSSHILLVITLISCASQIVFLAFNDDASRYWGVPLLVGLIFQVSYGASLVFYWAIFPQLAINDPRVRAARRNKVDPDEYAVIESMARSHISAVSTAWSNIGFFVISIILIGIGYILVRVYDQPWNDLPKYSLSIYSAFCGGYWLVFAIPWFVLQKKRPGPPLPSKAHYLTYGWIKVGRAIREYKRLPQTFLFLFGYFILVDAVYSTNVVTQYITSSLTNFDGLLQTYLNLVNSVCSIVGCFAFLYIQKWFCFSTKTMLQISTVFTLVIPVWGCVGLGSSVIGFHTVTELWIYNAWFGLFTAPFYAYSQTMMSELIPRGKENMFFGLFGILSKFSQFLGPTMISGITEATNNTRSGFVVCAVCQLLPIIIIGFVNMDQAEMRLKVYEEQERRKSQEAAESHPTAAVNNSPQHNSTRNSNSTSSLTLPSPKNI